jgi:hypothetical protein
MFEAAGDGIEHHARRESKRGANGAWRREEIEGPELSG